MPLTSIDFANSSIFSSSKFFLGCLLLGLILFISKKCIPFSSISSLFLTFLTSVTSISISSNNALRPFPSPPFLNATIQNPLPVQEILQQIHYMPLLPLILGHIALLGAHNLALPPI